jgi:hypothetical protein
MSRQRISRKEISWAAIVVQAAMAKTTVRAER